MTTWGILDGDPTPGDLGAITALSRQFGRAAEELREGRSRLSRMMAGGALPSWQGPAASAFTGALEPLRDDLGSAADSFDVAAAALGTYGRILDTLQARARSLLAQAVQAQQRIDAANLSLTRASWQAEQTIASQGLDPLAAMSYRRQMLAPHREAVSDAEAWLRSVRSQAQELRSEHEAAARRAADGFGHATKVGIHQTFREAVTDWAVARLTWVNDFTEGLKPNVTLLVVGLAVVAVTVASGGAAAPALALAIKVSAGVNAVDVGARIARRGLDDETMTDSDGKLAVDAGLAGLSFLSLAASASAAHKGADAMSAVRAGGYTTTTYQQVTAAHQAMNQAILLDRVDTTISVYEAGVVVVPRAIDLAAGTSPSAYSAPVPRLDSAITTASSPDDSMHAPVRMSSVAPLQGSLTTQSLQGADVAAVPGLQPVGPTIRTTSYVLPVEVRK